MIDYMLLTKESGFLKPFAMLIGYLIEGIYWVLEKVGIQNIGLSIILLTVIIYVLMLPLTYKQQKFSKLSAKMSPEIKAIQDKYKGKQDQDSMMKMQAETQAVYAKYGVSASGSCIQLLIQMPILFALYRVIYNIPAYIRSVGDIFRELSSRILENDNAEFLINSDVDSINRTVQMYGKHMTDGNMSNGVIDVLNRLSTADLDTVAQHYNLTELTIGKERILSTLDASKHVVENGQGLLDKINTFAFLNISNSPSYTIKAEWAMDHKNWIIIIIAILIPVLSALTQFINVKLMPQPQANTGSDNDNAMMSSMKTMNTVMPLFSAFMCFTLPVGIGIYWITGSVVRTIIQIILNKRIDKIDIDAMIKENIEKNNAKRAKQGLPPQTINTNAKINTKNVDRKEESRSKKNVDRAASIKESTEYYKNAANAKEGSLASKAFMVKNYNEKNNDKK